MVPRQSSRTNESFPRFQFLLDLLATPIFSQLGEDWPSPPRQNRSPFRRRATSWPGSLLTPWLQLGLIFGILLAPVSFWKYRQSSRTSLFVSAEEVLVEATPPPSNGCDVHEFRLPEASNQVQPGVLQYKYLRYFESPIRQPPLEEVFFVLEALKKTPSYKEKCPGGSNKFFFDKLKIFSQSDQEDVASSVGNDRPKK